MNNMQRLSLTLDGRMKKTSSAAVPTTIELGTINANLSLTTDGLRVPIPKGDYTVNLMLTGASQTGSVSLSYGGESHTHSHSIPSAWRGLAPGDRVLVAWCGNEPVVIAIIAASATLSYSGSNGASGGGSGGTDSGSPGSGGSDSSGTGADGEDGFSPTVVVTPIEGGNRVTITDVNGPKTFDVMDARTPVKGKDYFTAAEVEAIIAETVKRVTVEFESKFYTKAQIDQMMADFDIATDEEVEDILDKFYGEGE